MHEYDPNYQEHNNQINNPSYAPGGPPKNPPNNPYITYVDYYVMMNGRNRRVVHRCGIEDYFRKRLFDGINLNPNTNLEQYYNIVVTYVKGVYEEIINNKIFYPHLNAQQSAILIIGRILKSLVGELETSKIMELWALRNCDMCLDGIRYPW